MDARSTTPPPLRLLQSRARPPVRPAQQPAPVLAWWQRWVAWSGVRSA